MKKNQVAPASISSREPAPISWLATMLAGPYFVWSHQYVVTANLRKKKPSNMRYKIKILMSMGLDPMAEGMQQRTSLDVAAACGSEHILKLFERKPMDERLFSSDSST
jgi:hypothetical protein